ncbi:hypothetical protein M438DRAFT_383183 [Aureobasidium pullulans EXF-150]|uniref:Uncharacterized protein n=1 Tax=Aureobasidium pullulans EXF-150 TaxID=1043002 RepID=A0A074XDK8_AURPU|nr:uncharacterized protein M438DRAFT_383183 [Aureobasidium pullulans EXF-150]KEQ81814.1 hypothetical protein M438DRAFT_383183 [Aureobasidium pullulans EXF-150]
MPSLQMGDASDHRRMSVRIPGPPSLPSSPCTHVIVKMHDYFQISAASITDQPEESPEIQPFRFFDLPQELRFMIYEELMDNTKNDLKYVQPRGFEVESVYIDELHYPSMLRVCKMMNQEYWNLCLRGASLWITYSLPDPLSSDGEDSEDEGLDDDDEIPLLSTWVKIPKEALAKLGDVVFKFEARWNLPLINPFSGIARCTLEMPSLKSLLLYSEIEMWIIESAAEQDDKNLGFQWFVNGLFHEQHLLFDIEKEHDRKVETSVGGGLYSPLYEMNKRYRYPRRRHLAQGIAPVAGLPEWGYAIYKFVPPWSCPDDNAFDYHGQQVIFEHVEYALPVPERIDFWESCSEDEYDWNDGSDWAIGRASRV